MKTTTFTVTTTANGTCSPVPRRTVDVEAIKDLRLDTVDRVARAFGLAVTLVPRRSTEEGE